MVVQLRVMLYCVCATYGANVQTLNCAYTTGVGALEQNLAGFAKDKVTKEAAPSHCSCFAISHAVAAPEVQHEHSKAHSMHLQYFPVWCTTA